MAKALIFGSPEPNIQYIERRAAYVVIINDCKVAMVKSRQSHFLPGGGALAGEAPEDTVIREVDEELEILLTSMLTLQTELLIGIANDAQHLRSLGVSA